MTLYRLAAIGYVRGFDVDRLVLDPLCQRLVTDGLRLGGVIQSTTGDRGACESTAELVDLRTSQRFSVWEDRGGCASGCRLDERGLADAMPAIAAAIAAGVDLIVVNRFGRAESRGGGLLPALALAVEKGVPVLTAVRAPYVDAWAEFHGGMAAALPPELSRVLSWCRSVCDFGSARSATEMWSQAQAL
jgi:hypothetical protein